MAILHVFNLSQPEHLHHPPQHLVFFHQTDMIKNLHSTAIVDLCPVETLSIDNFMIQDRLLDAFRKVWDHLDEVEQYAKSIDYVKPWEELSKLPPKEQIVEYVSENLDSQFQQQRAK